MSEIDFNENLKLFREKKGLSGKKFALLLGIPYTTYMNYENKGGEPKFDTLIKMAQILDVSIDELLGYNYDLNEIRYIKCKKLVVTSGFEVEEIQDGSVLFVVIKYRDLRLAYVKKLFIEFIEGLEEECITTIEPLSNKLLINTISAEIFNLLEDADE